MALIAFAADSDQALGVSRFAADPDNRRAEYAIEVRGDWKGRGARLSPDDTADRSGTRAWH